MGDGPLVAVDFDKTLTDPEQDEWKPAFEQEPNPEIIEAVREAYQSGKKIVIWTARQWYEASEIAGWLTAHEVPYHGLRCEKGGAEKYVDDKTVRPSEFVAGGEAIGTMMCETETGESIIKLTGTFVGTD